MRVTRRQVLVGGAAAAGSVFLGSSGVAKALSKQYDLCVIGSGFAGTFLALRAVEQGLTTLLVEAGPHPRRNDPSGSKIAASFTAANSGPEKYAVNANRVIALGGTSNHWGGVVTRLWPDEFRMRSKYGRSVDWPISYGDLERYYCEAEQLLEVRGYPSVEGAEPPRGCAYPNEVDTPYVNPSVPVEGRKVRYFPVARSRRGRFAIRLIDVEIPQFERSKYGTLLLGSQVTRLVTTDGRNIHHAEVRKADGQELEVEARGFVVAAGAIESPRLLLVSTSEHAPKGLGNGTGLVGRYFNCHPSFESQFRVGPGVKIPKSGEYRTSSLADLYRQEGLNGAHFQLDILAPRAIRWRAQPEIEARVQNAVTLSNMAKDLFGHPLPEIEMSYSERDKETVRRLEASLAASRRALGGSEVKKYSRWRGHPAGTTRMGFNDKNGIVDANNKVFGFDNLYVSGACTFPTSGTPNPTDTVVAMTLRLADHLVERL
jgi:choline dehydrogenase-like flavoprotein